MRYGDNFIKVDISDVKDISRNCICHGNTTDQ